MRCTRRSPTRTVPAGVSLSPDISDISMPCLAIRWSTFDMATVAPIASAAVARARRNRRRVERPGQGVGRAELEP
ncbi:hypothetical protein GCM10027265_38240 [Jatrophihabitans fulvus]